MLLADTNIEFHLNWAVLVPVALGFVSIFLMLPTPRRGQPAFYVPLGLLAVVGFALFLSAGLRRGIENLVENGLFTGFSTLAIVFAALMITQRNPARAAMCFALVVLNVCGLFLLLAAPFLAAAALIIYAGAIIVTFLFVLMLSQQTGMTDANDRSREPFLATLVGFVLLGTLLVGLQRVYTTKGIDRPILAADRYARAEALDENLKDMGYVSTLLSEATAVKDRLAIGRPVVDPDGREAHRPHEAVQKVENAVKNLRNELSGKPDLLLVKAYFRELADNLNYLKAVREGTVNPNGDVLVSANGVSRVVPEPGTAPGANRLPAANVAAIGRTLFTDHLLAIELGGTLLLVATIGAIAIAGTRRERAAS